MAACVDHSSSEMTTCVYPQCQKDNIKVHFPAEQLTQHNLEIIVQNDSTSSRIAVHLGFLQLHHHYDVRFSVKDDLGEELTFDPLQNLHVKITEVSPSEDGEGHDVVVDLAAYKEKLMKEELLLSSALDSSKQVTLVIQARVLGKGKGTPALKNGIRCIGIDADEDSEQSDWQGFE